MKGIVEDRQDQQRHGHLDRRPEQHARQVGRHLGQVQGRQPENRVALVVEGDDRHGRNQRDLEEPEQQPGQAGQGEDPPQTLQRIEPLEVQRELFREKQQTRLAHVDRHRGDQQHA